LIGAYASVAIVCVASVTVGQAILRLCGWREWSWLSAPVGLAALLAIAGITVRLPGHVTAVAVAVPLVVGAAVVVLWTSRLGHPFLSPALAALVALLFASLPFIAAGRVGILGVGLVNDDMASHLLLSSWLTEDYNPEPLLVDQGYPLGPHALVAGIAKLIGASQIDVFAGLTLAIPVLTALLAFGALFGLRPVARTVAAAAVSMPYLIAAYLAQEAFKEPIMALFLLGFALALPRVLGARAAIPLGVLAAGTVYVYSFPGLAWLGGTAIVWAAIELLRGTRPRSVLAPVLAAVAVGVVLVLPDIGRVLDFVHFRALDPDRANEGGLGNVGGQLSPLEALGIWPTSEFRLEAGAGSLPAAAFYLGAAIAAAALCLGLPRWIRRHEWAVPAALATAVIAYVGARAFGTVYTSAKALAILSPLIALISLGGLLEPSAREAVPRLLRPVLAAALILGLAISSFLVLRQAPVGPTDHMDELAEIRPIVEGKKLLFLGRDNFVLYELRGSKPYTHVRNFYDPYFVKPNFELREVASKFDFDSVTAEKLARFPYVLTTRAAYASGPPPGYQVARLTPSYELWRQGAVSPLGRLPVERGPAPTGALDCGSARTRKAAIVEPGPRSVGPFSGWSRSATVEDGAPASISLDLPAGNWDVSLQYDATRPVVLSGPDINARLPGNLDYRGVAPYWRAGEVRSNGGSLELRASVERPPLAGRLLGASSVAHLGAIVFTSANQPGAQGGTQGLCGKRADWIQRRALR
jgi:hypothetical protein